jgi:hypothetical protein
MFGATRCRDFHMQFIIAPSPIIFESSLSNITGDIPITGALVFVSD